MSVPFKFYIRGTQEFFASSGEAGGVLLGADDDAPDTIGEPPDNGWILFSCYGADPELKNEGDVFKTPGLQEFQDYQPRWSFKVKTLRYSFPDDWEAFYNLQRALARKYVFLVQHTYDIQIHNPLEAMPVTAKVTHTHTYDDGSKQLTIEFRKRTVTEYL